MTERVFSEAALGQLRDYVLSLFTDLLAGVPTVVFSGLLIVPVMFYMYYRRRDEIARRVMDAVPAIWRPNLANAARDIGEQLHDFFTAKVTESTVVGATCCLGFFVGGVKGWLGVGREALRAAGDGVRRANLSDLQGRTAGVVRRARQAVPGASAYTPSPAGTDYGRVFSLGQDR